MSAIELPAPKRGWILYDAECRFCRNRVGRFRKTFERRDFAFAPLQLELKPGDRPTEMRVRSVNGGEFGGADAVLHLARFVWWARPLRWFAKLPRGKRVLRRIYREIASRRSCESGARLLPEVQR